MLLEREVKSVGMLVHLDLVDGMHLVGSKVEQDGTNGLIVVLPMNLEIDKTGKDGM